MSKTPGRWIHDSQARSPLAPAGMAWRSSRTAPNAAPSRWVIPQVYGLGEGFGLGAGEGCVVGEGGAVGEGEMGGGLGEGMLLGWIGLGVAVGDELGEGEGEGLAVGEGLAPLQPSLSEPVSMMSWVPSQALPSTTPSGRVGKPVYSAGKPLTNVRMMVSPRSSP